MRKSAVIFLLSLSLLPHAAFARDDGWGWGLGDIYSKDPDQQRIRNEKASNYTKLLIEDTTITKVAFDESKKKVTANYKDANHYERGTNASGRFWFSFESLTAKRLSWFENLIVARETGRPVTVTLGHTTWKDGVTSWTDWTPRKHEKWEILDIMLVD